MSTKSFVILAAVLLAATPTWAQQQQQGGGSRGGEGGGGTTTRPTTPTTPGGQPGGRPGQPGQTSDPFGQRGQQQQMPQIERPLMLSGQVRLADGSPPPESVTIYLDCDGQRVPKGYSNQKGHFSIDLSDRNQMAFADASFSGVPNGRGGVTGFGGSSLSGRSSGLGRYNLFGCALRAELAGFLSEPIELGARSVFDNPDVGIIVLRRLEGVEGSAISFTSLSAPKKAKKAYEKALKEVRKKKPNFKKADNELQKAVAEHPEFAAAWNLMGKIRLREKDAEGAREAFEKAAEADPKYLEPYPPLVRMALQGSRWDNAMQLSNHLLRLNPYMSEVRYFQAVAEYNLGRMEAAEKSVTEFHEDEKAGMFPQSHHLLGMIHVKRGQYESAAGEFRSYLHAQPNSPLAGHMEKQLKEWEALGVIEPRAAQAAAEPKP